MNNIFNAQRFFKLLNKHTREHYKTYLISTAVLIGILSLLMGCTAYLSGGQFGTNAQFGYFYIFLFLCGAIFTSMIFANLGDKKKSIPALTLPVSNLERFVVGWIYSYLIFQVIFVICFFTIDLIVISVGNMNPGVRNVLINSDENSDKLLMAFLIFGLVHASAFFGAIFFEKMQFIKTMFSVFIVLIILQLINIPLINFFFKISTRMQPIFAGVSLYETGKDPYVFIRPTADSYHVLMIMCLLVTLVLWAATFFKLKEKQV